MEAFGGERPSAFLQLPCSTQAMEAADAAAVLTFSGQLLGVGEMLWRAYQDAINGPMRPENYGAQIDLRRAMLLKNQRQLGADGGVILEGGVRPVLLIRIGLGLAALTFFLARPSLRRVLTGQRDSLQLRALLLFGALAAGFGAAALALSGPRFLIPLACVAPLVLLALRADLQRSVRSLAIPGALKRRSNPQAGSSEASAPSVSPVDGNASL